MAYPGPLAGNEDITRFVTARRYIKEGGARIHHAAFWPDDTRDYTTSMYRADGLDEPGVWALADATITESVLAKTAIKVQVARDNNLEVDPDDTPPRHANIINWPRDRKQYRVIAQKLAAQQARPQVR